MKTQEEIWYAVNSEFKGKKEWISLAIFLEFEMANDCYASANCDSSYNSPESWDRAVRIDTEEKHINIIRSSVKRILNLDMQNESFSAYHSTFPKFVCYLWAYDNEFDSEIYELYHTRDRAAALKLVKRVIDKFGFTEESDIWRENYE